MATLDITTAQKCRVRYSRLHYNGQILLVDLNKWAELTLNSVDHAEFVTDMAQEETYLTSAEANGKVSYAHLEPELDGNGTTIGHFFYIAKKPDGTPDVTPDHASRVKWEARFAADSNVEYWGKIWEVVS